MQELYKKYNRREKEANKKEWYKKNVDNIIFYSMNNSSHSDFINLSSKKREMKINYDLFNNIIDLSDFENICNPFGKEVGSMPADFTNKDIVSGKVKALLGMEMKRPFAWRVIAVNEEATTRKEMFEFEKLKQFVINSIIEPIKVDIEKKYQQESQNAEITPEQQQEIQQKIAQELKTQTPDEVKLYMEREHQDPAEVLSNQILNYLMQEQDLKTKFNKTWKHGVISGDEIMWVGVEHKKPVAKVVNPLNFCCDELTGSEFIQNSDWASYKIEMTFQEFGAFFQDEFTDIEIERIFGNAHNSNIMDFNSNSFTTGPTQFKVSVYHCEWKSLSPIKFLKSINPETGEEQNDIVDEIYKLNKEAGDIELTTEWIPRKFEGYKVIGDGDHYAFLREVPYQSLNLENLYKCDLSYIGVLHDNLNSESTSIVSRMKSYQYMYNIILYRIELLIASDYGKILLINAGFIPKSAGLSVEKWLYYLRTSKLGLMDTKEEGNKTGNQDITLAAKEIDMSLMSDINRYIQLSEYLERRCGESVGITKQVEGQIGSNDAVGNTQNALNQSANILEPYFDLHNLVKRDVLTALLECAKNIYPITKPKTLHYILDDMSIKMLTVDFELLENSVYGLFLSNSMKVTDVIEQLKQLGHAALQNQKIELSDFMNVLKSNSIQEIEENLKAAEKQRKEEVQQQQQQQQKSMEDMENKKIELRKEEMKHEMDMMIKQEELKTERELQKQTILSLGFNSDKDMDKDGIPDILEIYKEGANADLSKSRIQVEKDKLEQRKLEHKDYVELEKKKLERQVLDNKITTK